MTSDTKRDSLDVLASPAPGDATGETTVAPPVDIGPSTVAASSDFGGGDPSSLCLAYQGVNYVGDIDGSFADADSLSNLPPIGVGAVAVTADFGIDAVDNTVYDNDVAGGYTDTNADIAATVAEAAGDGLSVMVRPLIDFLPPSYITYPVSDPPDNPLNGGYDNHAFRSYYYPGAAGSAGADSFFASYKTMIVQQAALAQQNGAQLFCIGSELDQLCGPSYEQYWDNIISAVRAVFSGKLTYAADWNDASSPWQYAYGNGITVPPLGTGDITTQISFWSKLDDVGIDEYAPICDLANPTLQDLINGWTQVPTDAETLGITGQQSLISYYQGIAAATGKPLIFTELGYADSSDAAINPANPGTDLNGNPDGATADPTLQANLYQAFFDAWARDGNGSLAGVYFWDWEPGGAGISPFSVQGLPAETQLQDGFTACYAAGTRLATPGGEVPVERLRVGDLVLTHGGASRPVIWIGHRHVRPPSGVSEKDPIRVRAHAFAAGRPRRDLVLSPDHAVFVDEVLIPIDRLVNDATILREPMDAVTYWHVELESHDILLAEGLPAESYLDTGNRAAFANAAPQAGGAREADSAWAGAACATLVEDGPRLDAARARLAARAAALGMFARHVIDVVPEAVGTMALRIAPEISAVRLMSPASRPPGDRRRLGALVTGLRIDGFPVAPDDPVFAAGFHPIETHGATKVRWTDGHAVLAVGAARRERFLGIEIAAVRPGDPGSSPHPG